MDAIKNKKVTLHAYFVENTSHTKNNFGIFEMLYERLVESNSLLEDRILHLSDTEDESDVLSTFYFNRANEMFTGTIRPFVPSEDTTELSTEMFKKTIVTGQEFDQIIKEKIIEENSYFTTLAPCYIAVKGDNIIATTSNQYTRTRLEAYLNWLLTSQRGKYLIKLYQHTREITDEELNNSQAIVLDNNLEVPVEKEESMPANIFKLVKEGVLNNINSIDGLEDLDLNEVLNIQLFIKFRSRKKDDRKVRRKAFSKIAHSFAKEDIQIITKEGDKLNTSKPINIKKVEMIQLTSKKNLNEPILHMKIEEFFTELEQDEKNTSN